jgi:hypothetical protein
MVDLPPDWGARYAAWREVALPKIVAHENGAYDGYPYVELAPMARLAPGARPTRVALVSSGGLSLPDQAPFDPASPEGSPGIRIIPGPGPLPAWRIEHGHYDPTAARTDYNVVLPLDPLRDLVGPALAPRHVSFHGYQTNADAVVRELALEDHADAALLVPV